MSQIATACIGDTLLSVVSVQSLMPDDEMPFSYEIHFRDLPTGETQSIVAKNENDALMLFAAWFALDDENLGFLEPYANRLRATLTRKFKP